MSAFTLLQNLHAQGANLLEQLRCAKENGTSCSSARQEVKRKSLSQQNRVAVSEGLRLSRLLRSEDSNAETTRPFPATDWTRKRPDEKLSSGAGRWYMLGQN